MVEQNSKPEKLSIEVIIEIPKGSRNKYEFDHKRQVFKLDRMLFSSMHYPSDYGFIPETLAEDGDALDALVLLGEPTFPGCLIEARPVGLFRMRDEKGVDHKILAVPIYDPQWNYIHNLGEVPAHLLVEIEHFFDVYKELEKKKSAVEGWEDATSAFRIIEEARQRYLEQIKSK